MKKCENQAAENPGLVVYKRAKPRFRG